MTDPDTNDGSPNHAPFGAPSPSPNDAGATAATNARSALHVLPEVLAPRRRLRVLSRDDLDAIQPPTSLVDGILFEDTLAGLAAPPGSFKTIAALDLALSIAAGRPWHGRAVGQGPVLYILAEGTRGIRARVEAWERTRSLRTDAHFVLEAVQFLNPDEIGWLIAAVATWTAPPRLIVVDTLARCFLGGEENSATDMGRLVDQGDRLRRATGACVLFLHHVDQARGKIRGSTALPGALDTLIGLKVTGGLVQVVCDKQKDAEPFESFWLRPRTVDLGPLGSSVVLDPVVASVADGGSGHAMQATSQELLRLLGEFGIGGTTVGEWKRRAVETGVTAERTFARFKKNLVACGQVCESRRGKNVDCSVAPTPTVLSLEETPVAEVA